MNNFTPRAQQVLALARKEADRFNHNYVCVEHILFGLLKLGQGTAINVLQKMGPDLETIRLEIEKHVGSGPDTKLSGNIPYTPRLKKVLALAGKEAKALNHSYIGTEHILLALLREKDGIAAQVLLSLKFNLNRTRNEVLRELDPNFEVREDEDFTNEEIEVATFDIESGKKNLKTPALNAFGRNLSLESVNGSFDYIVEFPSDIKRLLQILVRQTRKNPVIVGPDGIGKSSTVYALANALNIRDFLHMDNKELILLDFGLLSAGTKYRGQLEERVKALMEEVKKSERFVLVLDDITSLVNQEPHVLNLMRFGVSLGEMQFIITATQEEYDLLISENRWLEPYLQPFHLYQKADEDLKLITSKWVKKYEEVYNIKGLNEILDPAIKISKLCYRDNPQPLATLSLLEELSSRLYLEQMHVPGSEELASRINEVRAKKEHFIAKQDFEQATICRDNEKLLKNQQIALIAKWKKKKKKTEIVKSVVYQVASDLTGLKIENTDDIDQALESNAGIALQEVSQLIPRFEKLQTESVLHGHDIHIEFGTGFVLMPHTDEFRGIFNQAIKPAMEENGIVVKKAEDIYEPGSILAQVWEQIRRSEIIIADLSGKNANVIFELGLCYGIQRCPILLVRDPNELPFNLRNLRYIQYSDKAQGAADLKQTLTASIGEFLAAVRTARERV
ncbi:MAG: Clp protease N-terminal domain-containing protein [Verrucomicrobiota bacterium]